MAAASRKAAEPASNVTPLRRRKKVAAASREAVASFTSWKLDMLNALAYDPRVPAWAFRIAFRVMQAVNADTRLAIISDLTLEDEVPSTDRVKCYKVRALLEELGWWTVERGQGGKASRYAFSPANINLILDQQALDRDERERVRQERKTRDRRRKPTAVNLQR
jgi:hypothetical protein